MSSEVSMVSFRRFPFERRGEFLFREQNGDVGFQSSVLEFFLTNHSSRKTQQEQMNLAC